VQVEAVTYDDDDNELMSKSAVDWDLEHESRQLLEKLRTKLVILRKKKYIDELVFHRLLLLQSMVHDSCRRAVEPLFNTCIHVAIFGMRVLSFIKPLYGCSLLHLMHNMLLPVFQKNTSRSRHKKLCGSPLCLLIACQCYLL